MSLSQRSAEAVFTDHLSLRRRGDIDLDISRNYDENVIIISNHGTFRGHEGVRESARILKTLVPTTEYKVERLTFHNETVYEVWSAQTESVKVEVGIDAFIIRNGKILVQTIYYDVMHANVLPGTEEVNEAPMPVLAMSLE